MNNQYAKEMIEYIYEEGDIDLIFFGQLLGLVSYDRNDHLLNKSPDERMEDAIKLVGYLVACGDFNLGETQENDDGTYVSSFEPMEFNDFRAKAYEIYACNGIDDVNLNFGIWLKKKCVGKSAPVIPPEVVKLFGNSQC